MAWQWTWLHARNDDHWWVVKRIVDGSGERLHTRLVCIHSTRVIKDSIKSMKAGDWEDGMINYSNT